MATTLRIYEVARQSITTDGSLSTTEQFDRMAAVRKTEKSRRVGFAEEQDVSGATPLDERDGLRRGIEMVEDRKADVIRVAYFDRLVRDMAIQREIVERVENAGGRVHALDVGDITHATSAGWLTSSFLGLVAEHHRRSSRERSMANVTTKIHMGIVPFDVMPPGLRKTAERKAEPDPEVAPIIAGAFAYRLDRGDGTPATIPMVRAWLAERGIERTEPGVRKLLRQRLYVGELKFGTRTVADFCEPIVARDVFDRVGRLTVTRGALTWSELLLARLGVLRCSTCDAKLVSGYTLRRDGQRHPVYRCGSTDCRRRVTVAAHAAEEVALAAAKAVLAEHHGRASADDEVEAARLVAELAKATYENAAGQMLGRTMTDSLREQLDALESDWLAKQAAYEDALATIAPDVTFTADDLDDAPAADQRLAIKWAVARIVVHPGSPGRGVDKRRLQPWGRGSNRPLELATR